MNTNGIGETKWDEITNKMQEYTSRFETVQQERSNYEIVHFIVGSEETPERQWRRAVLELQKVYFQIQKLTNEFAHKKYVIGTREVDLEMSAIKAKEIFEKKDFPDPEKEKTLFMMENIKTENLLINQMMGINLVELQLKIKGLIREAQAFITIIEQLEQDNSGPYSYNDIQINEKNYWRLRLEKLAMLGEGNPAIHVVNMLREIGRRYMPNMPEIQFFEDLPGKFKSIPLGNAIPASAVVKEAVAQVIKKGKKK